MPNPFDQFDTATKANPFDQFDTGAAAPAKTVRAKTKGKDGKPVYFDVAADANDETVQQAAMKATNDPRRRSVDRGNLPKDDSKARGFMLGLRDVGYKIANKLEMIPGAASLGKAAGELGNTIGVRGPVRENEMANNVAAHKAELANNTRTGFQTLGQIAGTIPAMGVPGGALAQGATTGLMLSDSDTLGGVAKDTTIGAVTGKLTQVGIDRVVAPLVKPIARGFSSLAGKAYGAASRKVASMAGREVEQPATRAEQIMLKKIAEQGGTPAEIAKTMAEAQKRGVPLAPMDTGDELRGAASSLSRKPGVNRTTVRGAVVPRQEAQMDRIIGAVERDLGPGTNVRALSEKLTKDAKEAAGPIYDQAYKNGGAPIFHNEVKDLLKRPSMKGALSRARTIAEEEGRDPNTLGLVIGKDDLLVRVDKPTWQTFDYIKRGLDDVIEGYRDKTTGRLVLDTQGRAINNTLREFLGRIDKVNPDYAAARAAYGGGASQAAALRKGASFGAKDAETIWAETRDLTKPQLAQYQLGVRSSIIKQLEARGDMADKVKAMIGTPKKRKALAQLFGGEEKFGRFMATLEDEAQAAATHARVNTGSPTAANLADDTDVDGLSGVALRAAGRGIGGQGVIRNGINTLSDLYAYGAGKAGEKTRAELAEAITNPDPAALGRLGDLANPKTIFPSLKLENLSKYAPGTVVQIRKIPSALRRTIPIAAAASVSNVNQ